MYKNLYIKYKLKYLELKKKINKQGGHYTKEEPDQFRELINAIIELIRNKAMAKDRSNYRKLFREDDELLSPEELEIIVNPIIDFINVIIDPENPRSVELMKKFCSTYSLPVSFPSIEEEFTNSQLLEIYLSDPEKYKILKLWFHNKLNNKRLGTFIDSTYSNATSKVSNIKLQRDLIPQLNVILSMVEERIKLMRSNELKDYLKANDIQVDDIFLKDEDAFIYIQFLKIYKDG